MRHEMPCRTYWALVLISASPGCKNTLTSGKGFMKPFCRTCQELLGKNNTQPKKAVVCLVFYSWFPCLEISTERTRGINLLAWDFQKHNSPDVEGRCSHSWAHLQGSASTATQPANPHKAQQKHTDLQSSSSTEVSDSWWLYPATGRCLHIMVESYCVISDRIVQIWSIISANTAHKIWGESQVQVSSILKNLLL